MQTTTSTPHWVTARICSTDLSSLYILLAHWSCLFLIRLSTSEGILSAWETNCKLVTRLESLLQAPRATGSQSFVSERTFSTNVDTATIHQYRCGKVYGKLSARRCLSSKLQHGELFTRQMLSLSTHPLLQGARLGQGQHRTCAWAVLTSSAQDEARVATQQQPGQTTESCYENETSFKRGTLPFIKILPINFT